MVKKYKPHDFLTYGLNIAYIYQFAIGTKHPLAPLFLLLLFALTTSRRSDRLFLMVSARSKAFIKCLWRFKSSTVFGGSNRSKKLIKTRVSSASDIRISVRSSLAALLRFSSPLCHFGIWCNLIHKRLFIKANVIKWQKLFNSYCSIHKVIT